MSVFWKAFAGGFVGKILAALFIAACAILGFGPEEWVAFVIEGLPIIEPIHARIGFIVLALATVFALAWANLKLVKIWPFPRESDFIPISDAARQYYEVARRDEMPIAQQAEKMSGMKPGHQTPEGENLLLEFMAKELSKNIPVYGTKPPSKKREPIRENDLKQMMFVEGATKLKDPLNPSYYYVNLAFKPEEFQEQVDFESGYHLK